VKNFFAAKDIGEAQRRLDRLMQEEVAATAAKILEVVQGQAQNMKKFIDGAQRYSASNPPCFEPGRFSRLKKIN
jgi:hypothetical protein